MAHHLPRLYSHHNTPKKGLCSRGNLVWCLVEPLGSHRWAQFCWKVPQSEPGQAPGVSSRDQGPLQGPGSRMSPEADFSWYKALGKEDIWTSVVRKHRVNSTKGYNTSPESLQQKWLPDWKYFCSWNGDLFSKGRWPELQRKSAWMIPIAPFGFVICQPTKSN